MDCQACGVRMTPHSGGGGTIKYFRCPTCRRWVSSTYAEVLASDAKFHSRPKGTVPRDEREFAAVKNRLERWLSAIDDQDPYRALGVSPMATDAVIKSRFRELAMQEHPDHGGSAERMRELNLAYERICQHRAKRQAVQVAYAPALRSA